MTILKTKRFFQDVRSFRGLGLGGDVLVRPPPVQLVNPGDHVVVQELVHHSDGHLLVKER